MRVFVTGATGVIGRRVVIDRLERGDHVVALSRDSARCSALFAAHVNRNITVVQGDPTLAGPWQGAVASCDAVIHLAGAGITDHRWTRAYKNTLFISRVESTHRIVEAIAHAPESRRPRVLVNGSAIGYYGNAGDRELDENAPPGTDFLAELALAWEEQAMLAQSTPGPAVRVVLLRTAVVLDDRGGALGQMMLPFRLLVGGPISSGRQWMSWIHWRDLVGLINLAMTDEGMTGPLNAAAPKPLRNREFARCLGRVMNRPSWFPAPKFALRIMMGEVANAIVSSVRVVPVKAMNSGFVFLHLDLEGALMSLIGQDANTSDDDFGIEPAQSMPTAFQSGASTSSSATLKPSQIVDARHSDVQPVPSRRKLESPNAVIKLLAVDVDGTLLNSDGTLSGGVIQACRAAERAGCLVVLATARAPRGLRSILRALDITGPTINYNGAAIWNPIDEAAHFHEPLPADVARRIVQDILSAQPQAMIGLEILNRWYMNQVDPEFIGTTDPENRPDAVGNLEPYLTEPVTKLNIMGSPEQLQSLRDMIRDRYWQRRQVAVFLTDPRLIQITHPLVDKGIALQRIARRMGLAREQVMAIGDASNDMGMIEWSGFGVAVDNAWPAVKQLADVIVPSNDELGVARAIQRYVLSRR